MELWSRFLIFIFIHNLLTIPTVYSTSVSSFQCSFQKDFVTFHHDFKYVEFYECQVQSPFAIKAKNRTLSLVQNKKTSHMANKTNDDVTELFINQKLLKYIPSNFGEIFKNLSYLAIWSSELMEINKKDFKQFPNLQFLCLRFNNFVVLGENLFEFNPKLEYLRLFGNQINEIHPTAFNGLTELKTLNLERNICVDKKFVNAKEKVQELILHVASLCEFYNEISDYTDD